MSFNTAPNVYETQWLQNIMTTSAALARQKQDCQALLKAKYFTWVAAVSCIQKRPKTHVTLTFEYHLEIQSGSSCCGTCSGLWVIELTKNFIAHLAMAKYPKIRSCVPDVWPMTLTFSRFLEVVKVHVHAKFVKLSAAVYELSCCQRKQTQLKTILVSDRHLT